MVFLSIDFCNEQNVSQPSHFAMNSKKKLVSWRLRNIRILLKETFLETFPAEFMKHDAKFYNAEEAILALVIILQEESSS